MFSTVAAGTRGIIELDKLDNSEVVRKIKDGASQILVMTNIQYSEEDPFDSWDGAS